LVLVPSFLFVLKGLLLVWLLGIVILDALGA
jgi:hypothetical protein